MLSASSSGLDADKATNQGSFLTKEVFVHQEQEWTTDLPAANLPGV